MKVHVRRIHRKGQADGQNRNGIAEGCKKAVQLMLLREERQRHGVKDENES